MSEDRQSQDELMRTMALLKVAFDLRHRHYHGFEHLVGEALRDMDIDPQDFARFTEDNRSPLEQQARDRGYDRSSDQEDPDRR